jgi:hypothetical protein
MRLIARNEAMEPAASARPSIFALASGHGPVRREPDGRDRLVHGLTAVPVRRITATRMTAAAGVPSTMHLQAGRMEKHTLWRHAGRGAHHVGQWLSCACRAAIRLLVVASMAFGCNAGAQVNADEAPAASERWSFRLTPNLWAAGLDGRIRTRAHLPAADVDVGFSEIWDHLDLALMLTGEARRGNLVLLADVNYLALNADAATRGPLFDGADVDSDVFFATLGAGYLLVERPRGSLHGGIGARIWSVSNDLTLKSGRLPEQRSGVDRDWIDPIVAVAGRLEIGPGYHLAGYADVGGFGAASDMTWQAYAAISYAISPSISLQAGYRYLSVDYQHDGFTFDVNLKGPMVGVGFSF